jgi:hypothetical protein
MVTNGSNSKGKGKEREKSLPEKWPLGIGGIYPHYSGDDGLFFWGQRKRGDGIGELMELIFCPSISNMAFFGYQGWDQGTSFWRCSYSMHTIVGVEKQSSTTPKYPHICRDGKWFRP